MDSFNTNEKFYGVKFLSKSAKIVPKNSPEEMGRERSVFLQLFNKSDDVALFVIEGVQVTFPQVFEISLLTMGHPVISVF